MRTVNTELLYRRNRNQRTDWPEFAVIEKNGLKFTDFNRTLSDAFANESILDMQGTVEALSRYYFKNGESFEGISVAPEYQERFERLMFEAIDYYAE